jgi:hypothetical protein
LASTDDLAFRAEDIVYGVGRCDRRQQQDRQGDSRREPSGGGMRRHPMTIRAGPRLGKYGFSETWNAVDSQLLDGPTSKCLPGAESSLSVYLTL